MGNMRITWRCTLISSAIVSQNRLNPIMQRAKIDRSVRRTLPVYGNEKGNAKKTLFYNPTANGIVEAQQGKVKCCACEYIRIYAVKIHLLQTVKKNT